MRLRSDSGDRARRILTEGENRFRANSFTIFEVSGDVPQRFSLGDSQWEDGEAVTLGIAYGNPLERPVGQLAQILTSRMGHEPEPQAVLEREHHERGLGPVDDLSRDRVTVLVGAEQIEASRIHSSQAWVVHFVVEDLVVTVMGVHWHPTRLYIRPVSDVEPYIRGRRDLLGPWAQ